MRVVYSQRMDTNNIDYTDTGEVIHHTPVVAHYHGDIVRLLFIANAVLMLVMQFTGDRMPMTPAGLLVFVTTLVIAAGITNPASRFIHWVNLLISFTGLVIFGSVSIERLDSVASFFTHDGIAGVITIVFLISMYLTTRTIRGVVTGTNPIISRTSDDY